jgi:cytochrome P450 family 135
MGDQAIVANRSVDRTSSSSSSSSGPGVVDGLPLRVRLPAVAQTLWLVFGMDSFARYVYDRYPEEGMLTARVLGFGDVVTVLDPDLIREVLTGDGEVLRAGEANAQALGFLGPNSVVLLDGEPHLRTRRLLLPPFHGEAIAHHQRVVEQVAAAEVERWPVGEPFALWPRIRAIGMEVILRTLFGVRDRERRRRLGELLPAFGGGGVFALMAETRLPWLTQSRLGRRLPWVKARTQAERLVYEEIADHRADPQGRDDVLAMLIAARDEDGRGLSDRELRDHMLTLVGGGFDTTAATLTWCLELVLRHPDVLERCREIDVEDEYLTAVVNETLRLRPVLDGASRILSAPLHLGGYRLPAGTWVAASIAGVQRSPKIYPDPWRFDPERFLGGRPAPYTLIPFGGGTRRCIGASFATMEIKTALRTVLQRIDLRPASPRPERPSRTRSIAIVPARGARVVAAARQR